MKIINVLMRIERHVENIASYLSRAIEANNQPNKKSIADSYPETQHEKESDKSMDIHDGPIEDNVRAFLDIWCEEMTKRGGGIPHERADLESLMSDYIEHTIDEGPDPHRMCMATIVALWQTLYGKSRANTIAWHYVSQDEKHGEEHTDIPRLMKLMVVRWGNPDPEVAHIRPTNKSRSQIYDWLIKNNIYAWAPVPVVPEPSMEQRKIGKGRCVTAKNK